jgi:hypothetical protein
MSSRIGEIGAIVNGYSHIFKEPNIMKSTYSKSSGKKEDMIFIPYIPRSQKIGGIELKDEVGYISIFERVKKGKPIEYVYKFITEEYESLTCRNIKGNNNDYVCNYHFHYDKCENDKPHEPHISVIHPNIRFISKEIGLKDFLYFIQETFFKREKTKYVRREENIWCNRAKEKV